MIKNNYLNNEIISDCVYNYMNFRKKENELVSIIRSIVIHLQLMPKFSGYPNDVKNDMMQVSMFNFFNNIHDIKFSKKKIAKIIKLKQKSFFEKYDSDNILKEVAGENFYCHSIHKNKKILQCYRIIKKLEENINEDELNSKVKNLSKNESIKKVTVRINAVDYKEFYVIVNTEKSYDLEYNVIEFNFFSFITQTVLTSFTQVLNKENMVKEASQVILWGKTDAYKFDINNIDVQKNIVNVIKEVSKNYEKRRNR